MLGCPLGLEPCDQKPVSLDAKRYAINCENYFYCRSWVLPWSLPLHRIKANTDPLKFDSVGHDYYLVEFLNGYGYSREEVEGMQERDWAAYFAEQGYAEAVRVPRYNYLRKIFSLSRFENDRIEYKPRCITFTFPNGMTQISMVFDAFIPPG